ncbi:plasmid pRiA4b ORF-3 family protein [Negadavirga shengliensis]|uniref:Plasmid pRiA4b ORF-3 family protein n=1 Tax=Negadavirga shengliensis TaxID=1389218 RepID=A0ABV9T837_9BACT
MTQIAKLYGSPIKINVKLEDMPHNVFRRLLLPENTNMMQLHAVIQLAMGWEFSHLFQFSDKKYKGNIIASYGQDDGFGDFMENEKEAHLVSLKKDFLEKGERKPFWYWYDFGDDWWHKITFLKPSKKDLELYSAAPVCVEAHGKCPPEDVGGPWGYSAFCEAINDKKHPEYKEYREWLGLNLKAKYDFETVDTEAINQDLESYFFSRYWKRNTKKSFSEGW